MPTAVMSTVVIIAFIEHDCAVIFGPNRNDQSIISSHTYSESCRSCMSIVQMPKLSRSILLGQRMRSDRSDRCRNNIDRRIESLESIEADDRRRISTLPSVADGPTTRHTHNRQQWVENETNIYLCNDANFEM
jgi:hypothetical protein